MKILITAGGTVESIDDVRGITNFATGNLGKITAEKFLSNGHFVHLIIGPNVVKPETHENLLLHPISSVSDLMNTMEAIIPQVDVVIHSMAVSDYSPIAIAGFDEIPNKLDNLSNLTERKISSSAEYQVLVLKKTPKVISFVKKWNPNVKLFAFKLLSGSSKETLLEIAQQSLLKNQADFMLANDLDNIDENHHHAFLLDSSSNLTEFHSKSDIADGILQKAEENS